MASAISVALDVPQSTVTIRETPAATAASIAASDRPCPSSSRFGTYGRTVEPEAAQRDGQDRQTGQTVGVEVAEDLDALRALAGAEQAVQQQGGVREAGWVVEAGERLGEPGTKLVRRHDASSSQEPGHPW